MKNRIAIKLSLYFSAALILLSMIIGVLFFFLFKNYTLNERKKDMSARAELIASALSGFMSTGGSGLTGGANGSGKGTGGYGAYLKFIDDIAGTPVWIVDENLNLMTTSMPGEAQGKGFNISDLPGDAGQVVKEAFKGRTTFSQGFSDLLNSPTLTVGTPINMGSRIVGIVLLHAPVGGVSETANQGFILLAVSISSALVITVILSFFLAARVTHPLKLMQASTARLAAGDYTVKTHIARNDEIGELAGSIDVLSVKLHEAREATDKLDRLRRDFVANVSHELRTPITVMRGSLEALCDGVVTDPEQVKNYHRQMLGETLSLQRLVNDLMELSRLQNADFSIAASALNLYDVLSDAARSARQLAEAKKVTILFEAASEVFPITGDYSRLRQMFLIVLDNAVKFSPPGRDVTILLEKCVVKIRDTGSGIPPEDQPYIFDRFYKVKSGDNKTGSGLGLAIARQIAERHQIKLSVNSQYTAGAEFIFEL